VLCGTWIVDVSRSCGICFDIFCNNKVFQTLLCLFHVVGIVGPFSGICVLCRAIRRSRLVRGI
jgi:hypothetical protein